MAIPIFINRVKHEAPRESLTGLEILAVGGFGADHDLFLLQGEGDPSGGTPIGLDQRIHPEVISIARQQVRPACD